MAMCLHINHITKVEFFLALKAAYFSAMTESNNRGGFRGAGLVPFNPEVVWMSGYER